MKDQAMDKYKPAEKLELKEVAKEFPKVYKKVNCPSCEKEVDADNLNLANSLAKCSSCNVIFSIEEEVAEVKTKKEMKQDVFRPEGIDLFHYKDDLDITIQQHIQAIDIFGLSLFPVGAIFSILLYFFEGIHIGFPIILTLVAMVFIYRIMDYSKNKTYIELNKDFLSIKSRPKHFKKDRLYDTYDIDQLYLKHAADGSGYYTIFMIINGVNGQKHEKLLSVNTLSKAKYLEQEIELYLNIENKTVIEANVS